MSLSPTMEISSIGLCPSFIQTSICHLLIFHFINQSSFKLSLLVCQLFWSSTSTYLPTNFTLLVIHPPLHSLYHPPTSSFPISPTHLFIPYITHPPFHSLYHPPTHFTMFITHLFIPYITHPLISPCLSPTHLLHHYSHPLTHLLTVSQDLLGGKMQALQHRHGQGGRHEKAARTWLFIQSFSQYGLFLVSLLYTSRSFFIDTSYSS